MKKFILYTLACALVIIPATASAMAPDVYANSIQDKSVANALYPEKAVGAPDGAYMDFLDKDGYVRFDLGEGEEGLGDLTMHMILLNLGAAARIEFLDTNFNILDTESVIFKIGDTTRVIPYNETAPYRYVSITSIEDEIFKLDAIETSALANSLPDTEPEPTIETEPESTPDPEPEFPERGFLIKLVDDGDLSTDYDSAVYVIGNNGMRHAFPTATIFFSWYQNFDNVSEVDLATMSSYPLGKNVTVRPGTHLVKVTTVPKVYAVEPGGILRWISSESIAKDLYGTNWSDRVIDVPDVFFNNYSIGDPIETNIHPDGTLGVALLTGEVLYLQNTTYFSLPGSSYNFHRFNSDFHTPITDSVLGQYINGGDLKNTPEIAYPY